MKLVSTPKIGRVDDGRTEYSLCHDSFTLRMTLILHSCDIRKPTILGCSKYPSYRIYSMFT